MPSRFTAQSGKGVLFVALALVATLLVPSVYTWAVKPGEGKPGIVLSGQEDLRQNDPEATAYFQRLAIEDRERPLDVAPLGDFTPNIPDPSQRKGLIYTQVGFFNPKDSRAFDGLPADLRPVAAQAAPSGKGLGLGNSVGIIQISEDALKTRGFDGIEAEIKDLGVRVLDTRPDRALVVKGDSKALAALVKASFVEASLPYAPAFKIEPVTGRQMLADKIRASKKELDIHISAWDPSDVEGLLKDLKAGHGDTVSLLEDGATIRATLTVVDLKNVARDERVKNISEIPEYQLSAFAEQPPVDQVGENENTGAATPYWDAFVDGGGCGNPASPPIGNTDTRNCSTPAVPAVIVAVTDNGASTDSAALADNLNPVSDATIRYLIDNNLHRKIRNYYEVIDDSTGEVGSTCDSILTGGQTHGNVVAGTILGNASALGFQFAMNTEAGNPAERKNLNLDGTARNARLVMQDAALSLSCTIAEFVERGAFVTVSSGLKPLMDSAYGLGARLHVFPFGSPNWTSTGTTRAGLYTADALDLDTYLVNNLEYQVFVPVGNKGQSLTNSRNMIPDMFDGTSSATSDPSTVGAATPLYLPMQISPPATAKNIVSAGSTVTDTGTMFGPFNEEELMAAFTSKGPATIASLRVAPLVNAAGNDRSTTGGGPVPMGIYAVRSRDNSQDTVATSGGVETAIDQQARGTSFAAAHVASVATLIEDYLHQGFYPSGDRVQADRVSMVSGAALKAMLASSANFAQQYVGPNMSSRGMDGYDAQVATARGSVVPVGEPIPLSVVLLNNHQGYGRVIASQVLPLANWPFIIVPPDYLVTNDSAERPALGLLIFDGVDPDGAGGVYTAEPPMTTAGVVNHHFRVIGNTGQIRACVTWPDPPGDLLVNDLDLELIDPNSKIYDGNVYNPFNEFVGQWGLARGVGDDRGDTRNTIECVHLTDDPDANTGTPDNQIIPGVWTLRIRNGIGGAFPGTITQVNGTNEDTNGNNRLDANENDGAATLPADDADGLLDKGGQIYAAVVSGPIVAALPRADADVAKTELDTFPQSIVRLDKIRYSCSDNAGVQVWSYGATANDLSTAVTLKVYNTSGTLVDTEANLSFSGTGGVYTLVPAIATRLNAAGTAGNGILEGDTGYKIEVVLDDPGSTRLLYARAPMDCEPNFLAGIFGIPSQRDKQDLVFGGCDHDQYFDSGEVVTYSVAVVNQSREDEFTDVTANLKTCAAPFVNGVCGTVDPYLAVLDNNQNIGRLPLGQPQAITFSIQVGTIPAGVISTVYLRLELSQTSNGKIVARLTNEFSHALGADRQGVHYSTDYPTGSGTIARDLNRSLVIEPNDRPGVSLGLLDETIQFQSLFTTDPATGRINNQIGPTNDEAYPAGGNFVSDPGTVMTNGILDRGILSDPVLGDMVPWNFDNNHGGWYAVRDASTIVGTSPATLPLWHYVTNGTCGFQTQSNSNCVMPGSLPNTNGTPGRVTGLGTCSTGSAACTTDKDCGVNGPCTGVTCVSLAVCVGGSNPGTSCNSPDDCTGGGVCTPASVGVGGVWHTGNGTATSDTPACGNYGLGYNPATAVRAEFILDYMISPVIQKVNQGTDAKGYPYTVEFQRLGLNQSIQLRYSPHLYIDIDNDIDNDNPKAIIRAGNGPRGDGTQYYLDDIIGPIAPKGYDYYQRTFGPETDPDNKTALSGDETGYAGSDAATTNTAYTYTTDGTIIPTARIDNRPFPGPGEVFAPGSQDTVAGPSRAYDLDMVDYEDWGLQFFTPGDAGNRFQIGFYFLVIETNAGAGDGDFGVAIDDVVFEWDEVHPVAEATPSCNKIGTGLPDQIAAGCKCSTLSVDRTNLYDCNDVLTVTVNDTRYLSTAVAPCATGNSGAPDTVTVRVWSNSEPYPGENATLTETGNATGVFKGTVQVSGVFDSPGVLFTTPGTETNIFVAYEDSQCDSNQNKIAGQSDFNNIDGDGIEAAAGRDGICGTDDDNPTYTGVDGICGAARVCSNDPTKVCTANSSCVSPGTCLPAAIDDTGDNSALTYNPSQGDDDGDKVGGSISGGIFYGHDNCPYLSNPDQADGDQDGVGDACDYDDVDFDGIINEVDNCPDVYNPDQLKGASTHGDACDDPIDSDGDGVADKDDNCVLTYNFGQADADYNEVDTVPLGNACDGDCLGLCSVTTAMRCTFSTGCPVGETCVSRVCSTTNDDADLDHASDSDDNCPDVYNPTYLPGSDPPVQGDDNFNGVGNVCDPAGSFDENLDGIPDDVANGPFFSLAVTCKNVPLANLVIWSTVTRDRGELTCSGGPSVFTCSNGFNIGKACTTGADCAQVCQGGTRNGTSCADTGATNCTTAGGSCVDGGSCLNVANACGDGDSFGDPGERVVLGLIIQNLTGINLTGINFSLSTGDSDIACILDASIIVPSLPNGSILDTRSLVATTFTPDGNFFEVVVSDTVETTNTAQAQQGSLVLTMNSNEVGGTTIPVPVAFLEDLDLPTGVTATPTPARCDADKTPLNAGKLCPGGDPDCGSVIGACMPGLLYEGFESPGLVPTDNGGDFPQNNDFSNTIGFVEKNAESDSDTTVVGKACWGFIEVYEWTAAGGCQIDPDFDTDWHFDLAGMNIPAPKAMHGTKSAHWGRHTDPLSRAGDTLPLRQIDAFVTNPINLTLTPGPTDLLLSFYHIAHGADDNRINFAVGQAGDFFDVQISVDLDSSSADKFGRWQKLAPFQNVYEHTPQVYSWFGYCEFTPTDAAKPANPTVYAETMCFPDMIWSHSGNVLGTNVFAFYQAQGPGYLGSVGDGVWVQSKFNLALFIAQRVRFRWIAQGWHFSSGWDSYMEPPGSAPPFDIGTSDDGWWLDSIRLTGAVVSPVLPVLEPTVIPMGSQCPLPGANCTPGTNLGFNILFTVTDSNGDGVVVSGETLLLDASQTVNTGGCADGVAQFKFYGGIDGTTVLQDWSSAGSLTVGNTADLELYKVQARCSSDFDCTTLPTGPPTGADLLGCRVYLGLPPAPIEAALTFTLTSTSKNMSMTMPNFLLTGPGTPPAIALPHSVYGHSFLRTDALAVGTGATDGGISGTCGTVNCTITQSFKNLPTFTTTGMASASSCNIDSYQHTCNAPTPSTINLVDADVPAVGYLYYYLGDTFTTPSGSTSKTFGPYGGTASTRARANTVAGTCVLLACNNGSPGTNGSGACASDNDCGLRNRTVTPSCP